MRRKTRDDFMPADVGRTTFSTVNQAGVFVWNGNAIETEDNYNRAMRVWDRCVTSGIKNCENYENNGESILLAIQGQVEPALWDKTKDDPRFAAIQTLKCPIELINLMKERCTGAAAGVWGQLAMIKKFGRTVSYSQSSPRGGRMSCPLMITSAQWSLMLLLHASWLVCWLLDQHSWNPFWLQHN